MATLPKGFRAGETVPLGYARTHAMYLSTLMYDDVPYGPLRGLSDRLRHRLEREGMHGDKTVAVPVQEFMVWSCAVLDARFDGSELPGAPD